ncbi:MAG: hypothetical protein JW807_10845 [Spirochaetes bacterium]|nr:hypothetical protein [Spirochaetota bacterium]
MKRSFTWRFPSVIDLIAVQKYLQTLEKASDIDTIVFDMTRTIGIHSAFMWFLVYAMNRLLTRGRNVVFLMSPHMRQSIAMLGMSDYFNCVDNPRKAA